MCLAALVSQKELFSDENSIEKTLIRRINYRKKSKHYEFQKLIFKDETYIKFRYFHVVICCHITNRCTE